ncbi:hypothetical protein GR160_00740 [Flavobacterium sp. Sd200]|uniref:hypothetical protein n=1 Tax=Flavobacterium sp. Sd200 TaxID=2692211 RepID=UPI001367D8B8|nr:hypothetical protein [Flavobacterium sp. Sd200]MXN89741.1 hypothetical protein [Flavobacterium sp. Sd200]
MKKLYTLLLLMLTFNAVFAQREVESGSFKALAGIKQYNVVFDYTNMKIADFETEEEFLKSKMAKREGQKAEDFKIKWFADREANYEPKFIAYFNKRVANKEVVMAKDATAKYTLQVKTIWLYPGYNVGVGKEEAKISAVLTVYETANPENILIKVFYDKSPGIEPLPGTSAYDPGNRIAGAYEKLAKNFTIQLKRYL